MSIYSSNYESVAGRQRRKPDRKRRFLKKMGNFMLFLMVVCLAVALVFLATGLFMKVTVAAKNQRLMLAGLSCGGAVVSLLGYFVFVGLRHLYSKGKEHSRRSPVNSGSALLMVLVLLAVAAGVLMQLQSASRIRLRRAESGLRTARLRIVAVDAAKQLLQRLADDEDLLADHVSEEWAEPLAIEHPDGVVVRGRILDAQSRFDLNNLAATRPANSSERAAQALRDIIHECGLARSGGVVEALADWIDADQDGLYESRIYLKKDLPYETPNGTMDSIQELDWIEGWSLEMLAAINQEGRPALRELVAVIPVERREPIAVNVNTAPPQLLKTLLGAGNSQIVDLLVSMRTELPIRSLAMLENAVGSFELERIEPYLDVKSEFFDVRVDAEHEGHAVLLSALAQRASDGTVSVLRWNL